MGLLREQLMSKYAELEETIILSFEEEKLKIASIEERLKKINVHDDLLEKWRTKQKDIGFFQRRLLHA